MDVARSAPQGAHYHEGAFLLLWWEILRGVKELEAFRVRHTQHNSRPSGEHTLTLHTKYVMFEAPEADVVVVVV